MPPTSRPRPTPRGPQPGEANLRLVHSADTVCEELPGPPALLVDDAEASAPPSPARGGRRRSLCRAAALVAAAALTAVILALVGGQPAGQALRAPQAVILGAVEGITEYLPISSTGHLVVTQRLLGLGGTPAADAALDSYAVVIQGGAILAVGLLFRKRLAGAAAALVGMLPLPARLRLRLGSAHPADRRVAIAILVAAAPAGVLGLVAGDALKERLFAPAPIAVAWLAGGAALVALSSWLRRRAEASDSLGCSLDRIVWKQALIVGLVQSIALWPGVSRSLVTIVGGCLAGLALPAAVELSFLVGFVVLLAATGLELARHGGDIVAAFGWLNPLLGMAVAFTAAVAAIQWLLSVVSGRSLAGFGWYRLAAGAVALALIANGTL